MTFLVGDIQYLLFWPRRSGRSRLSQIDQCAGLWLCLWFLQYCRQILGIPVLEC
jgi:hypothetical protein